MRRALGQAAKCDEETLVEWRSRKPCTYGQAHVPSKAWELSKRFKYKKKETRIDPNMQKEQQQQQQ